jgi:hypothetical protein
VTKPFFGKPKLSIEVKSNRLLYGLPKLVLCACPLDGHLLSYNDAKAQTVLEVDEMTFDVPQKNFKYDFEIPSSQLPKKSKLFLFKFNSEANPSDNNEKYLLSWASEFNGKV